MKTLIVGGTGYIGSALYEYLNGKENHDIESIDLEWFFSAKNNKKLISTKSKTIQNMTI